MLTMLKQKYINVALSRQLHASIYVYLLALQTIVVEWFRLVFCQFCRFLCSALSLFSYYIPLLRSIQTRDFK